MCPLVTPDLSEEIKPIEPGIYSARITSGEVKVSKRGQNMIKWTFSLFGREDVFGRTVTMHTMLSGPTISKLKQLYKAATGEDLPNGDFDTDILLGKEVTLVLDKGKNQDGQESKYLDVKSVSPIENLPV
jgi:hypothetical protein